MANKPDWSQVSSGASDTELDFKATEIGDGFTGEFARMDLVTTKFGDKIVMEFVECSSIKMDGEKVKAGSLTVWPNGSLAGELKAISPNYGDTVKAKFVEEKDTDKGNPLKVWSVKVKPALVTTDDTGVAGDGPGDEDF